MGIAVENTKLWGPLPSPDNSSLESPSNGGIAVREVLRCGRCSLVQFRTASDLCRRCAKPLPTHPSEQPAVIYEEEAAPEAAVLESESPAGSSMPLERGARNRRLTVGSKLGAIRKERALTQVEMAELLGIPRSYLSRIENNRLLPGPLMVAKFAEALDVEISELLDPARPDRSMRLPADPIGTSLLRHFATLQMPQQAEILLRVRQMLGLSISLRPATDALPATTQLPELEPPMLRREPVAPVQHLRPLPMVAAGHAQATRSATGRFPVRATKASPGRLTRAAR
jgi:transcriptional regulator with XRE-family HTH domain